MLSPRHKLYLASASPRRLALLGQIGYVPDYVVPADIDEAHQAGESIHKMTQRLAHAKAHKIAADIADGFVLAADTAIEIGGKTLGKASSFEDVLSMISRLSGRRHRVYTSVVLIQVVSGEVAKSACKTSKTSITLKRLTGGEISEYAASGLGIGREGGFNIHSKLEAFVKLISGSYSGIVGLPLYETYSLFNGMGFCSHH
jgi:septum formation protein